MSLTRDLAVRLPPIGVGTWAWGNRFLWGYRPDRDDPILLATFKACVAAGLVFFDTADSYGTGRLQGRSEALLGQALATLSPAQRQAVVVATKLAPYPWRIGRRGLQQAAAASRARLGGRIDLLQLHWSTARYAPWQEGALLRGLADQLHPDHTTALGVSNMGPKRLRHHASWMAASGAPLSSVQIQFSLLAQQPRRPGGLLDVCRELGIVVIAYSPLALGLLGGRHTPDHVPPGPRGLLFRRLLPRLQPLLGLLREIGEGHGATPAAVAVNWCRSHGTMPIPGLRHPHQVSTMRQALGWMLSSSEQESLNRMSAGVATLMPANPFQSA